MCSCRGSEPESCDHLACDQLKAFASSCQPDTVNIGERPCPGKQRIKEEKHKGNEDDADAFKKVYEKAIEQNLHLRSSAKTVYAKGMGLGFSDAMSF